MCDRNPTTSVETVSASPPLSLTRPPSHAVARSSMPLPAALRSPQPKKQVLLWQWPLHTSADPQMVGDMYTSV